MSKSPSIEFADATDLAFWKPAANQKEFAAFCAVAREKKVRAVCVTGSRVALASAGFEGSNIQLVALVGFPLGANDSDVKRYETEVAVDFGAQEVELVLNLDHLKNNGHKAAMREWNDVLEAAGDCHVCAVLETRALTRAEIVTACGLISESGIRAVSTGTDFWPDTRVTPDDVKAIRDALDPKILVKAVGNIRDAETATALLQAGAARIGTINAGIFPKS